MQAPKPPSRRLQRVSELLRREMSEIIRRDFPIEQAGLLTINDVVVAPDLRTATAYVGFVGTPAQRKAAPDRLESRASRFQQILGSHLRLKWTPVVRFILDDSVERGNRVLAVIEEIEHQAPAAPAKTPPPAS
jgi:ribosome-binding factor A